jgi:hypothetical protein
MSFLCRYVCQPIYRQEACHMTTIPVTLYPHHSTGFLRSLFYLFCNSLVLSVILHYSILLDFHYYFIITYLDLDLDPYNTCDKYWTRCYSRTLFPNTLDIDDYVNISYMILLYISMAMQGIKR